MAGLTPGGPGGPGAEGAQPVRIATFNTHHAVALDGAPALERIAGLIDALAPDVIALQEVDRDWRRSGFVDQPARYAALLGMRAVFAANLRLPPEEPGRGHREYGTLLLTPHPLIRERRHPLTVPLGAEPRGLQEAVVDVRGRRIRIAGVHLHDGDDTVSARQAEEVLRCIAVDAAATDEPVIVLGDLNAEPGRGAHRVLTGAGFEDAWAVAGRGAGETFRDPDSGVSARIDHILVRGATVLTARVGGSVPTPSDHEPLIVELDLSRYTGALE